MRKGPCFGGPQDGVYHMLVISYIHLITCHYINYEIILYCIITKASRTSWLLVFCERSENLGGGVAKQVHFSSLSWCSGCQLAVFCRVMYQVANG